MAYQEQTWKDLPDQTTPLSADRLNHLETQYKEAKAYTDFRVDSLPPPGAVNTVNGVEGPDVVLSAEDVGAATPEYVDLVTEEFYDFQDEVAFKQDLIHGVRVEHSISGQMNISANNEFAVFTAVQPVEIVGASLTFDNAMSVSGTTNKFEVWIFHRPDTGGTRRDIVQKSTSQEGITVRRKPWSLTNGSWGPEQDRVVPVGNSVSLFFTQFSGNAEAKFPVYLQLQWRPVR